MDDDIRDYIEGFSLKNDATDKVSLRALGSHMSGLGRDSIFPTSFNLTLVLTNELKRFPDLYQQNVAKDIEIRAPAFCDPGTPDRSNGSRVCSREEILEAISNRSLAFDPWTRPLYSNTGFDLLGWASAEAAKRGKAMSPQENEGDPLILEDLLQQDVFDPLEMHDTYFWVPTEKRDKIAVPELGVPSLVDWDFTSVFNPYLSNFQWDLTAELEVYLAQPTILLGLQVTSYYCQTPLS